MLCLLNGGMSYRVTKHPSLTTLYTNVEFKKEDTLYN